MPRLEELAAFLNNSVAVRDKLEISRAYAPAVEANLGGAALGDDCAAIPDPSGGYLLLAAEGMLKHFVANDPWFAGYSAVMVNISDVCAMGGRPLAIVDVLWASDHERTQPVWDGMKTAAHDYGVPIVGGHTTITHGAGSVYLAAAILGRAKVLMTSFDAQPGDSLVMVVDLKGSFRNDKPFWNASVGAPPETLRTNIELIPRIAESHWCRAAKDISNGGIIGTLVMLLQCSRVGAVLDLDSLPAPPGIDLEKWLISFPSYGYLLSVSKANQVPVINLLTEHRLACKVVGEVTANSDLELKLAGESIVFWRRNDGGGDYA